MRNIFLIIRRHFKLLTFVVLQFFALMMLFRYNKHHRAVFLGRANEITGYVNTRYDKVDDYFHLKEENDRLHMMNDSLLNILPYNFIEKDTTERQVADTVRFDTTNLIRRYYARQAKVVSNSINDQNNYIQINRGARYGVRDNMTVVNSDGSVVGVVLNVSENFSQIRSLLHRQTKVSAMLKRNNSLGTIEWDGKDAKILTLRGVSKSDTVTKGDTVVTSPYSGFPPGFLIGTIVDIVDDKATTSYVLKVMPFANFHNLQRVHVIENLQSDEQAKLDKETRKKVDELNRRKQ
jgi:rod shape-determining protein MreC